MSAIEQVAAFCAGFFFMFAVMRGPQVAEIVAGRLRRRAS